MDISKVRVMFGGDMAFIDFDEFKVSFMEGGDQYELVETVERTFAYIQNSTLKPFDTETNRLIREHYLAWIGQHSYQDVKHDPNPLLGKGIFAGRFDLDNFVYPFDSHRKREGNWTDNNLDEENKRFVLKPQYIARLWLFQPGERDGYGDDSWRMVGKTKRGYYFCFEASCCYTGFELGGGVVSWSKDPEKLWLSGLDESMRKRIQERLMRRRRR